LFYQSEIEYKCFCGDVVRDNSYINNLFWRTRRAYDNVDSTLRLLLNPNPEMPMFSCLLRSCLLRSCLLSSRLLLSCIMPVALRHSCLGKCTPTLLLHALLPPSLALLPHASCIPASGSALLPPALLHSRLHLQAPNHGNQSRHPITAAPSHSTQSRHPITSPNHITQSQHPITNHNSTQIQHPSNQITQSHHSIAALSATTIRGADPSVKRQLSMIISRLCRAFELKFSENAFLIGKPR